MAAAGLKVQHTTVDPACGTYCYLAGTWAFALDGGVLYPGFAPFPSGDLQRISAAPPDQPTWLATHVLWWDAAGRVHTLYTAPRGWVVLGLTADGSWSAAVAGPPQDLLSQAQSATEPWTLVAFDAGGTLRTLGSSPGGGEALPPAVDLYAAGAAWTVPLQADVQPHIEDLSTGQAHTVPTGLPSGTMLDGLRLQADGDLMVAAGPSNHADIWYRLHDGTATPLGATAVATLAEGTATGSWADSLTISLPGADRPLTLSARDLFPLPGDDAENLWLSDGRRLVRLAPRPGAAATYEVPPGPVSADGAGLGWARLVAVADHHTMDLWWTQGGA